MRPYACLLRSVLTATAAVTCWSGSVVAMAAGQPPEPPSFSTTVPVASTVSTSCGAVRACLNATLRLINLDRARNGLNPLAFTRRQSDGGNGCPGSYGHSSAMALSGSIWHVNRRFPRASFPHNICVMYRSAGENVGESSTGNVSDDLQTLDRLMMSEPHTATACAASYNHACNILNPIFRHVGIGIYLKGGVTWLTEDFLG